MTAYLELGQKEYFEILNRSSCEQNLEGSKTCTIHLCQRLGGVNALIHAMIVELEINSGYNGLSVGLKSFSNYLIFFGTFLWSMAVLNFPMIEMFLYLCIYIHVIYMYIFPIMGNLIQMPN